MAHGLPKPDAGAVGSGFSLQPHAYVQGPAQQCPLGHHRQPAHQMGSWALPAGTRRNSSGHEWLWLPQDLGTIWSWIHHEVMCPSLDPSGGRIPPS